MKELCKFLRNHANWHQDNICGKAPEVVEHVKQLREWAAEVEALTNTVPKCAEEASEQMKDCILDPMWANHCGVAKNTIQKWRRALHNAYSEGYIQRGLDATGKNHD